MSTLIHKYLIFKVSVSCSMGEKPICNAQINVPFNYHFLKNNYCWLYHQAFQICYYCLIHWCFHKCNVTTYDTNMAKAAIIVWEDALSSAKKRHHWSKAGPERVDLNLLKMEGKNITSIIEFPFSMSLCCVWTSSHLSSF